MKDDLQQFTVLEHTEVGGIHWDLMLENAGTLLTWRLEVPPEQFGNEPIRASRIADHPLRFLCYEGPVQHNTGMVRRIDKGSCRLFTRGESCLIAILDGEKMKGQFTLQRTGDGPDWTLQR